jgi:hypothetical protein
MHIGTGVFGAAVPVPWLTMWIDNDVNEVSPSEGMIARPSDQRDMDQFHVPNLCSEHLGS